MENLSMFNTKMREKRDIEYDELVQKINNNIEIMMKDQQYTLTELEQLKIDSLNTQELLQLVLKNQDKDRENINRILEKLDKEGY